MVTVNDIVEAIERFKNDNGSTEGLIFHTAGTGLVESVAIEFFRFTNVIVVTRNGDMYERGVKIRRASDRNGKKK